MGIDVDREARAPAFRVPKRNARCEQASNINRNSARAGGQPASHDTCLFQLLSPTPSLRVDGCFPILMWAWLTLGPMYMMHEAASSHSRDIQCTVDRFVVIARGKSNTRSWGRETTRPSARLDSLHSCRVSDGHRRVVSSLIVCLPTNVDMNVPSHSHRSAINSPIRLVSNHIAVRKA